MTALFDSQYEAGAVFELTCKMRIEQREWEVTFAGAEHCYPGTTLAILHKAGADLGGPDLVAAKAPRMCWAIDAKTCMPRSDGSQRLPGMGLFTITERALRAMQRFVSGHSIPGLFVLDDDQEGICLTPHEVRTHGRPDDGFWWVSATSGRPLSHYFGDLPPGEVNATWTGEYPGDFPIAPAA